MEILLPETVLGTILSEALGGVYHKDALASIRAFLVEEQKIVKKVLKLQQAKEKASAKAQ
jgi:hypothetical protein